MSGALVQGRAVAAMLLQGARNSLHRRQGAGALAVFPLLLAVLLVELGRFGGRGALGVHRVFAVAGDEQGRRFATMWLSVMLAAIVAMKFARAIPGRGARPLFDTVLFRSLPVSAAARSGFELVAGSLHAVGFVVLAFAPALHGVVARRHHGPAALVLTTALTLGADVLATLVAHALYVMVGRSLGGRALDRVRVLAGVAGVGLVGLFSTAGPIGQGLARSVHANRLRPLPWSGLGVVDAMVRWLVDGGESSAGHALLHAALWTAACVAVLAWRIRSPGDLALDGPLEGAAGTHWEPDLRGVRAEWRMLRRQAPYLALATPAFLLFFAVVVRGARASTGSDVPWVTLAGLLGWAVVVQGTALTGAASRRWRRVLGVLPSAGGDARETVRAVGRLHFALTACLALTALMPAWFAAPPAWWWFPREVIGLLVLLGVGAWAQSSALFLCIDPSPDRLTGLSVGGVFAVLATSLPTAALAALLSATPLPSWLGLVGLFALFAWSLERSATARLRWLRDPMGDPDAARRTWPALRAFGAAGLAQVLVVQVAEGLRWPASTTLLLALGVFAAVLVPLSRQGARVHPGTPRWSAAHGIVAGAGTALVVFAVGLGYARLAARVGTDPAPLAAAFAHTRGALRVALVVAATTVVPWAEEGFFRGWLLPALRVDTGSTRVAWVLSAAVFAMVHAGASWAPAMVGGLAAGALFLRGGRLAAPLSMHIVHNALVLLVALRTG